MVEIVFGDSACASLKTAQNYGRGTYYGGCTGIVISHADGTKPSEQEIEDAKREFEQKERLAWENAVPLGGNSDDVYGFDLSLSVGNIAEDQPNTQRLQVLEWLNSIYPSDMRNQVAEELLHSANESFKMVCERTMAGEDIRIWYSSQPDELCGMYWFMEQLNRLHTYRDQIYLVKLPNLEYDEKRKTAQKSCWSEVHPAEWHQYLDLQTKVSVTFCQHCAAHWSTLQKENAPLRATLNGQLVSVPETLYDSFIMHEIAQADDKFQEAMIVGKVLGNYRLGIRDAWVALRIEEMIRAGKLKALTAAEDDMPIYCRLLKKVF